MRFVKPRKPRGKKLNGEASYDMCPGCYMPGCDPFAASDKYRKKINDRQKRGVCPACGHKPCKCKSSLTASVPTMKTHNNRRDGNT